jgi:hypothetical protein
LEYLEDLRRSVRIYLGLVWMLRQRGWSFQEIYDYQLPWLASACGTKLRKLEEIARLVAVSENPVVRKALTYGLPLSALSDLEHHKSYHCPTCEYKRFQVPCCKCAQPWPEELRPDLAEEEDAPLRRPKKPTGHEPGSWAKIEVMRKRLARGESCFHKDDRQSDSRYNDAWTPDMVSRITVTSDWDPEN